MLAPSCAARLSEWCDANCPHAARFGPLHALYDRSSQSDRYAWRCYAAATLDATQTRYVSGNTYCTRHAQLLVEKQGCSDEQPVAKGDVGVVPQLIDAPRYISASHPWYRVGHARARVLSLRPLVAEVPDFLTADECDGIIRATAGQAEEKFPPGPDSERTWWIHPSRAHADAELISSVERRIDNLVGLPAHPGEDAMKVTVSASPWSTDAYVHAEPRVAPMHAEPPGDDIRKEVLQPAPREDWAATPRCDGPRLPQHARAWRAHCLPSSLAQRLRRAQLSPDHSAKWRLLEGGRGGSGVRREAGACSRRGESSR